MLRIVLDTNVLLVSISTKSNYHWILESFQKRKFELAISNEILSEYEEQIGKHWNAVVALNVIKSMVEAPNAIFINPFFYFNLISADADDNKFADCAIISQSDYLVSFDKHFDILQTINFPKINVIKPTELKQLLQNF